MKHAHEISLENKLKCNQKTNDALNYIAERLENIDDRLDHLITYKDFEDIIMIFKSNENYKKCCKSNKCSSFKKWWQFWK